MTSNENVFENCCVYLLPNGLGKKRLSLFENEIKTNGGLCESAFSSKVTHVVVEDSIAADPARCKNILYNAGFTGKCKITVVNTKWISECLKLKMQVDHNSFGFVLEKVEERDVRLLTESHTSTQESPPKKVKTELQKFACSHASAKADELVEPNQNITSELQKLADAFRSRGDQWRSHGYDKAISAIKSYKKEITSYEEARAIPGIGDKMAKKVQEILELGQLRKVKEICDDEKTKVLELFTKVWGAGPAVANSWFLQGFRTLKDLEEKADLTKQQKVGLKYFDDIQARIPRSEVEEIVSVVQRCGLSIDSSLVIEAVGSYRRGKPDCGDIDIMVSHGDIANSDVLYQIINQLKTSGIITDDLTSMESSSEHKKYLGMCRLPGEDRKNRRIDIFTIPKSEYATALMHYTGSALFNRSIRQLAITKGMKLSESKLVTIVGQSECILTTPTEESIFEHLGLPYRPPEERDH